MDFNVGKSKHRLVGLYIAEPYVHTYQSDSFAAFCVRPTRSSGITTL